jgi:putative copper resistance protein D
MELIVWDGLVFGTRWLLYLGAAAAIGGSASLWMMQQQIVLRPVLMRYSLIATLLAVSAAILHFLVRVGEAYDEGLSGMFDPDMIGFMWESPLGEALFLRSIGLLMILAGLLFLALVRSGNREQRIELGLIEGLFVLAGMGLMALSFSEAGHAVEQPLLFQSVLTIHVVLTAWWMGSLYPLWLACHHLEFNEAYSLLDRFGQLAVTAVLVLLAGGVYMSYELTGWSNLFSSNYGILLLVKVGLVGVILSLAAIHKLILVPRLQHTQDAGVLKRSIFLEKIVGAAIFAITTVLTTLVGPVQ